MKNQRNRSNKGRLDIVIGLALLVLLSATLQTTGGTAKYRTQVVVPGTIRLETTAHTGDVDSPAEPETVEPEIVEPETVEPETVEPEIVEPETVEPETVEPETAEPETVEPEIVEPETAEPEVTEPEVEQSEGGDMQSQP